MSPLPEKFRMPPNSSVRYLEHKLAQIKDNLNGLVTTSAAVEKHKMYVSLLTNFRKIEECIQKGCAPKTIIDSVTIESNSTIEEYPADGIRRSFIRIKGDLCGVFSACKGEYKYASINPNNPCEMVELTISLPANDEICYLRFLELFEDYRSNLPPDMDLEKDFNEEALEVFLQRASSKFASLPRITDDWNLNKIYDSDGRWWSQPAQDGTMHYTRYLDTLLKKALLLYDFFGSDSHNEGGTYFPTYHSHDPKARYFINSMLSLVEIFTIKDLNGEILEQRYEMATDGWPWDSWGMKGLDNGQPRETYNGYKCFSIDGSCNIVFTRCAKFVDNLAYKHDPLYRYGRKLEEHTGFYFGHIKILLEGDYWFAARDFFRKQLSGLNLDIDWERNTYWHEAVREGMTSSVERPPLPYDFQLGSKC